MSRVNIWIPDDLHAEVRRADINVSAVTQAALRQAIAGRRTETWLKSLTELEPIDRNDGLVAEVKDELWGDV